MNREGAPQMTGGMGMGGPAPQMTGDSAVAPSGHLYMQTNELRNAVVHYHRSANGTIEEVDRVSTGGAGSGVFKPTSGQESAPNAFEVAASVILSPDRRFLFTTNGGDNSVSSFAVGEDGRLTLVDVFDPNRVLGVETGSCPHTAVRDDPTMNLAAIEEMTQRFPDTDIVFVESGGDNLTLTFSPALADYFIFVIDVAEGDKIPRKRGPGITNCDLLVIGVPAPDLRKG